METNLFNLSSGLLYIILASVLFIKRTPDKKPRNLLAVLFVLIAIYTWFISFHFEFVHTSNISYLSYYLPIDALPLMLMGPCLYFYVLLILNRPMKLFHWKMTVHLTPLIPCIVFNFMFLNKPIAERIEWLTHDFYKGSPEMTIINTVLYLQIIFYLFISYLAVSKQIKLSAHIEKNGFRTNITWIKSFLIVNISIIIISIPVCFIINNEQTNIIIGQTAMNIDFIFLFIISVLKIGFMDTEKIEEKKTSYLINQIQAARYWQILTEYMDTRKPYQDEDCSLHSLAKSINISDHQLSKLLNAHGGISFSDYINEYRIKEAVIYLEDRSKKRKNIDTIAIECGFGSRSSFYRAFEKVYYTTPAAYRNKLKSNFND